MTGKNLTDNGSHFLNGMDATKCGGIHLKRQFGSGDITWIKIRDSSWWPAQVVDEKNVSHKPNKKAKDEVLVRLYGTYDYLFVDPAKSSSEFENILKQENYTIREAFQKALDEDLSGMKSAGNSKRKVYESKENATAETPKGKKQKQDKIVIDLEADDPASPGPPSGRPKKARGDQKKEKDKGRVYALREKKTKQAAVRKPKVTEKARDGAPEDKSGKPKVTEKARDGASEVKSGKPKDPKVTGKVRDRASKDTSGKTKKPKVTEKARHGVSKDKSGKPKEPKVIEKARDGASKDKRVKPKEMRGDQKEKDEARDKASGTKKRKQDGASKGESAKKTRQGGASNEKSLKQGGASKDNNVKRGKIKSTKQEVLRQCEHSDIKEHVTEKVGDEASKAKSVKQGGAGKPNVTEEAIYVASKVKNTKRDGSSRSKLRDLEEHPKTESPISTKCGTPEQTPDLSARRVRVMQSLGLIAPLGSPFRKNGLVGAILQNQ